MASLRFETTWYMELGVEIDFQSYLNHPARQADDTLIIVMGRWQYAQNH